MAIIDKYDEPLAVELGLRLDHLTNRVKNWLWLNMNLWPSFAPIPRVKSPNDNDGMIYFHKTHGEFASWFTSVFHSTFQADESLSWITDDERQLNWLLIHLIQLPSLQRINLLELKGIVNDRDLAITFIDYLPTDFLNKNTQIGNIRFQWNKHLNLDKIFSWFANIDQTERCDLMWNFLLKNEPASLYGKDRFNDLKTMLLFFDRSEFSHDRKLLLIQQVKKRWSQNQYRQKLVEKKQINLVLSSKVINQLDKLTEEFRLTRAQILETLISDEAKKKFYLKERLTKITALTSIDNLL